MRTATITSPIAFCCTDTHLLDSCRAIWLTEIDTLSIGKISLEMSNCPFHIPQVKQNVLEASYYLKVSDPKYITAIPSEILKNRMRHTENSGGLAHLHVFSASHFHVRSALCILRLIIIKGFNFVASRLIHWG